MKVRLLTLTVALISMLGASEMLMAQCASVSLNNTGPCTVQFCLLTDAGTLVCPTFGPGGGVAFFPPPPGEQWVTLVSVSIVPTTPCTAFWTQVVNIPLGVALVLSAPLPAPYTRVTVIGGCSITAI